MAQLHGWRSQETSSSSLHKDNEARTFSPRVVRVDRDNRICRIEGASIGFVEPTQGVPSARMKPDCVSKESKLRRGLGKPARGRRPRVLKPRAPPEVSCFSQLPGRSRDPAAPRAGPCSNGAPAAYRFVTYKANIRL